MENKDFYNEETQDIIKLFHSNHNEGLSAEQVELNRIKYGENSLSEEKKQSKIVKFLKQYLEPTTLILIIAAIISLFLGEYDNSIAITILLLINGVIGFIQENNAETSLQAIKKISSAQTTVVRDGNQKRISLNEVTVGDIIFLEAGDYIPADLRLFEVNDLQVDESALTGESLPIAKTAEVQVSQNLPLGDRINMAYMNTLVTYGRGKGIVIAVGKETEMGQIAELLRDIRPEKTPLQKQLSEISKLLSIVAVVICLIIFVIGVIQGQDIYDIAMSAFSLAIAAIPEGMPLIVTMILVMGIRDMAKNNAIMKNLTAIETAGASDIVLSDKTGTLTQNKMTVTSMYTYKNVFDIKEAPDKNEDFERLVMLGILNNDSLIGAETDHPTVLGEPTESAILQAILTLEIDIDKIKGAYPRIDEIPFDSERKLMTTVHEHDRERFVVVKGAPETLIERCHSIYVDGSQKILNADMKGQIIEQTKKYGEEALRVIAAAFKPISEIKNQKETYEDDLVFVGLFAMIDPPKDEAKETIIRFQEAGIDTAMITGDNKITATAIAKSLGIVSDDSRTISGMELDQLPADELLKIIDNYRVFARVTPHHKLRIVNAFQEQGHVAIMTGDGVNDAPALKKADIGVSMGQGGTEVAKGAADMILVDDNFSTISYAIVYGRQAYNNIKRSIQLMLTGNVAGILGIFLSTTFGTLLFGTPVVLLNAVQILWFNVVSDTLLSVALGMEPVDKEIMSEKPRKKSESFFGNGLGFNILMNGGMIGILAFVAFTIGSFIGGNSTEALSQANTMAFMTLSFAQFFHVFNLKSPTEFAFKKLFSNRPLIIVFLLNVFLQILIIFVPILRTGLFGMGMLSPIQWGVVGFLSLIPFFIIELKKAIFHKK